MGKKKRKLTAEQQIAMAYGRNKKYVEATTPAGQDAKAIFEKEVKSRMSEGDDLKTAIKKSTNYRVRLYDKAEAEARWYHERLKTGLTSTQIRKFNKLGGSLAFGNMEFEKEYSATDAPIEIINGEMYGIRKTYYDRKNDIYLHEAFKDNDSRQRKAYLIEDIRNGIRVL